MNVKLEPGSPEWLAMISPSKVAAILGVSRYESPFRLWHRMKGITPAQEHKDIFTVGHAFEPALAYLWKAENPGWQLSPGEVQIPRHDLPFPALATIDRRRKPLGGSPVRGILEFKTARSLEEWGDDFTDQVPVDYAVQVHAQRLFTGYKIPSHLMVMTAFFRHHTYVIEQDTAIEDLIMAKCTAFHASLQLDTAPDLDDTVHTYECMKQLHPDIDGNTIELDPQVALDYLQAVEAERAAEKATVGTKTRVLAAMGNAQTAQVAGVKVAGRSPHASGSVQLKAPHKPSAVITAIKEKTS